MKSAKSEMIRNVTIRQLQIFAHVAQQLSFSKAAECINLSQPAVSLQVRQLEIMAGMALLERSGRKISLTEAGRVLVDCTRRIEWTLTEAREALQALQGVRAGTLRLGSMSTDTNFSPLLLAQFAQQHPGITVRFNAGTVNDITEQLERNEIDIAILGRTIHEDHLVIEPFARIAFVPVVSPKHALANKRRITIARLSKERLLCRERDSEMRIEIERLFQKYKAPFEPALEAKAYEVIKQAAMAGMGVGFGSLHMFALELQTEKLVALDVVDFPLMRDWRIVYLREKQLSPIAAAFRQFLLKEGAKSINEFTNRRIAVKA